MGENAILNEGLAGCFSGVWFGFVDPPVVLSACSEKGAVSDDRPRLTGEHPDNFSSLKSEAESGGEAGVSPSEAAFFLFWWIGVSSVGSGCFSRLSRATLGPGGGGLFRFCTAALWLKGRWLLLFRGEAEAPCPDT